MVGRMTDTRRERIDVAWAAWREAEAAYRDEVGNLTSAWWEGEPMRAPEKVLTHETLRVVKELREAAKAAQDALQAAVDNR